MTSSKIDTDNMPTIRFKVTVAGYERVGRRGRNPIRLAITKISWDESRGAAAYTVSKIWYARTEARNEEPVLFSKIAAEAVVDNLKRRFRLVDPRIEPVEVK